ncbi:ROK family protein, partial [Jeotgalibaca porci]
AGIIINGELYHGRNGHSGEVGHMILYPHGVACPCGNKGCLEQYCSEKAILQQYRLLKADDTRTLYDLADDYYAGDQDVITFIEKAAHEISIGIRNIISGFAPGVVYINSPLTRKLPFLLTLINNCIRSKFSKEVPILTSEIGATASLLGAAVLNLQNFFNIPHLHFSEEPLEKLTPVL